MLLLSPCRRPGAPVGTRVPARGYERQHLVTAVVVTLRPRPLAAAPATGCRLAAPRAAPRPARPGTRPGVPTGTAPRRRPTIPTARVAGGTAAIGSAAAAAVATTAS